MQVKATLFDDFLVGYARVQQACRKPASSRRCPWATGHVKHAGAVSDALGTVAFVVRAGVRKRGSTAIRAALRVASWTAKREYGFQRGMVRGLRLRKAQETSPIPFCLATTRPFSNVATKEYRLVRRSCSDVHPAPANDSCPHARPLPLAQPPAHHTSRSATAKRPLTSHTFFTLVAAPTAKPVRAETAIDNLVDYPDTGMVILVCDNLKMYTAVKALCETFLVCKACCLAKGLDVRYMPKHSSSVVQIDFGVLTNQGLNRRIAKPERLCWRTRLD